MEQLEEKQLKGFQNELEGVLNSYINIKDKNGKVVFQIEPLWIEYYFWLKNGNNLQDPSCDYGKVGTENKLTGHKLYFRSFKPGSDWKRNRMDICVGKENEYRSILIKRARFLKADGKDAATDKTIYADSQIASKLLVYDGYKKSNANDEYDYYSYELISKNGALEKEKIGYCGRIGIYGDKSNSFNEEPLAAYIKDLFEIRTFIKDKTDKSDKN